MADLSRDQMQRLARLGAEARLEELRREESAIRSAFPDLFGGRARAGRRGRRRGRPSMDGAGPAAQSEGTDAARGQQAARRRRRSRPMSAAMRKAVSERMKKYWADRRKAKAKGA